MTTVLVTGARGFVGRNLCVHLARLPDVTLLPYDVSGAVDGDEVLRRGIAEADVVFHLAGVNRPADPAEFVTGNAGFTAELCRRLAEARRTPHILFSSTIQATLDNPYGASKRAAEKELCRWAEAVPDDAGARVTVFRLTNLFGKWCRPNYNSVVATFCDNIAHDRPVEVRDPAYVVRLAYIDDVVVALLTAAGLVEGVAPFAIRYEIGSSGFRRVVDGCVPEHAITLCELAEKIRFFRTMPETYQVPDSADLFDRRLRATYLSYLDPPQWEYGPVIRSDERGNLAELLKSPHFGQIFVSRTRPGITRGNHYHHTKTEKFIVVAGTGLIRLRRIDPCGTVVDDGTEIVEFTVRGEEYRIVDIPPGWTHSITNIGDDELVTLFHASEIFDSDAPDTFYEPV